MESLPLKEVPSGARAGATYAAAAMLGLAREEARGRRGRRLLEDGLATWRRFRGRLDHAALLELLLEDAAITQPVPFDAGAIAPGGRAVDGLTDEIVAGWIEALRDMDLEADGPDYVMAQARLLGRPTHLGRSNLHKVKPHHRVLELPGTGGQLAHHICSEQDDIYLQDVFTIACDGWRDQTLAGLVAVDLGVKGEAPIVLDPDLSRSREAVDGFDYVIGLDPAKGGVFDKPQLEQWFSKPEATVLLV